MKAHTLEWTRIDGRRKARQFNSARRLNRVMSLSANLFLALVPALAVVAGAVWLITAPGAAAYLQAFLWGAGFVFLGVAVDAPRPWGVMSLLTGLALPTVAMLSSHVAIEMAILAVAVLSAWTALAIWRHAAVRAPSGNPAPRDL